MRYQYYFCEPFRASLEEYLKEKKLKYNKSENDITVAILCFSLWSNTENLNEIFSELKNLKVKKPLVFASYTASEINNAKLLVMTPKRQCIDIVNDEAAYEYFCKWTTSMGVEKVKHEKQVGTFAIGKEPSTKTSTAFWTEDTGFAEVFTDRRVYELVKEHSLNGILFEKVMNRKGIYSENIFQVKSDSLITRESIDLGHGEKKVVCHICGKEQFDIDDIYQLHLNLSKLGGESDLYMTERIWGGGIAYPLYVISQRFYQLLKQNKLAGGITVSPVVEVSK